jgi:hypothetical protein
MAWTVTIKDDDGIVRFVGTVADNDRDFIDITKKLDGTASAKVVVSDMLAALEVAT